LNLTKINPNLKILTVFYSKNFGIIVLQKWIVGYLRMVWTIEKGKSDVGGNRKNGVQY